jgi:hydroxymethylpyrimidine/phosphomethylpyrimidine kinase
MHELKLHTSYCESFGVSIEQIRATPEKQGKFKQFDDK